MVNDKNIICFDKDVSYRGLQSVGFFSEYQYTKDLENFLKLLKAYEKINISKFSALSEQIDILGEIKDCFSEDNLYLKNIKENIVKKRKHLVELRNLHEKNILRDKKELYNPEIESIFIDKDKDLLSLKNDLIYDFESNVIIGKYILEAIDPSHRFALANYIKSWQNGKTKTPFFLYLEKNCHYDLIPQVEYFSENVLKSYQIQVKDGLLLTFDGKPLTTSPEKEFLFVLGKDNNFYGCYGDKRHKHTSLSIGMPIKCGGSLVARDGIITALNLDSGHYFPTLAHLHKMVYFLQKNNVELNQNIPVAYHENYVRKIISLKKGLEK